VGSVLIVGGGITGIESALTLARLGVETTLVEMNDQLGGNLNALGATFPEGRDASALLELRVKELSASSKVTVLTGAELSSLGGEYPQFKAALKTPQGKNEVVSTSVIVATGFSPFNPVELTHYGFGTQPDVITALELSGKLKSGTIAKNSDGTPPEAITFVQCIGSRDLHTRTYCSEFCCMYAVHMANQVKAVLPQCRVTLLYMDIRTPFCAELIYEEARRSGVSFLRSKPAKIRTEGENGNLTVQYEDTLDGSLRFLDAGMVVLSIGALPRGETPSLASSLNIECEETGFFKYERAPVFTRNKGVFLAGCAGGPKDITSCLAEGSAAAAQAAILLKEH
jgi:heterodisulfide reductase subunit A